MLTLQIQRLNQQSEVRWRTLNSSSTRERVEASAIKPSLLAGGRNSVVHKWTPNLYLSITTGFADASPVAKFSSPQTDYLGKMSID